MSRWLFTAVLVLTLSQFALAEGNSSTSAPSDSPKQALKAQDAAAKSGNIDSDMGFYQAEGDQQKKLARAMAEGDVAVAKLQQAVEKRFGKELAVAVERAAGSEDVEAVNSATEKVDGDKATVQFKSQSSGVPMVRADGKWKVALAEWTSGASAEQVDQLTAALQKLTAAITHIDDLVSHDKFRSGEGVRDRVQEIHDQLFPK